jgi:hypothetical protein
LVEYVFDSQRRVYGFEGIFESRNIVKEASCVGKGEKGILCQIVVANQPKGYDTEKSYQEDSYFF